jgi:hypothetical protein
VGVRVGLGVLVIVGVGLGPQVGEAVAVRVGLGVEVGGMVMKSESAKTHTSGQSSNISSR